MGPHAKLIVLKVGIEAKEKFRRNLIRCKTRVWNDSSKVVTLSNVNKHKL